ncbi:hypothetical protein [Clostridium perfringens]|uniref:hypothetical protein n=1 Tax=Clostridium perfringens TaxID=1502 RepID=UPI003221782A
MKFENWTIDELFERCIDTEDGAVFMNSDEVAALRRKIAVLRSAQPVNSGYKLPDDTQRMDWLVAHHVTVRKPLRYGSEAMFTAQTITDEEDDYHATKLREQIDAAMLAAAPEGGNG